MPEVLVDFYQAAFWFLVVIGLFAVSGYVMFKISDGETWGLFAFIGGWIGIWFAFPFLWWFFTGEVMLSAD